MGVRLLVLMMSMWALVAAGCSCNGDDEPNDGNRADDAGAAGMGGMAGGEAGSTGEAEMCASDDCSLIDNGCEADEGCHFLEPENGDPTAVCQQAGDAEDGEPCEGPSDCAPGLGCSATENGGDGTCHAYCCELGAQGSCPEEQQCVLSLGFGVGFCDACEDCDLVEGTCGDGQGCYPVSDDNQCKLCLGSLRMLDEGELCDHANDCAPGLGCYALDGAAPACRAFCDLEAEEGCDTGFACEDNLGLDGVGLCVPGA